MNLIDADALKEAVNAKKVVGRFNTIQLIDNAPTVEPVKQCKFCKHWGDEEYCSDCHSDHSLFEYYSRPHGKWKNAYADGFLCSECFMHNNNYTNFCPNCGADMRGEE